ncbi:sigma-54-dependent transcriptional regulator [Siphonobacter sp.]|uniref:sigma-54-dependent transcriptional regulator n=1 Tax=Siphonobacter sp. TaxID=1869184 RepID=UPI003B3A7EEF
MQKILVIDDDTDICLLLRRFLGRNGFEVAIAHNGTSGLEILTDFKPDLVMTDFRLGDMDGGELLVRIKEQFPHVPVIVITGYSDIKIAVNVMKQGAYDYVTKPLFPDEILVTIRKALDQSTAQPTAPSVNGETGTSTPAPKRPTGSEQYIFGSGPESKYLYRQVDLVAPTNYSVIIYGESGSGKEAVAQEIHKRSKRSSGPFVAMDCGAISKDLAGSELFGHEKGAFTGALNQKIGHFEQAHGGTLFLDEVSNLPYDVQVSLLRVVQERKLRRLGGTKETPIDVRIIVASNERLIESAKKGKFREDLYYRFNEFSIDVPPLRERNADILVFADYFLQATNGELGKQVRGFADDVVDLFMRYEWPGNLREMRNVIKRATLLTDSEAIQSRDLPFEIVHFNKLQSMETNTPPVTPVYVPEIPVIPPQTYYSEPPVGIVAPDVPKGEKPNLRSAALEAEYDMILKTLKQVNFNKSKAAQLLGIDRKTLYNKMKNYHLS